MNNYFHRISEIEEKLSYKFKDKELLKLSFIHRSFWNEHKDEFPSHNERLEFLGDSVLGVIVAEFLYKNFPTLPEGVLSDLRAGLVNTDACATYFTKLLLEPYLLLGKGERMNEGKGRKTIIADLFEAIIGAIYLDGGFLEVKRFFLNHFQEEINQNVALPASNWKAELQDYVQKKFHQTPLYKVLEESGPSHDKKFVIAVVINNKEIAVGEGGSKKVAQIEAAKNALKHYEDQNRS